MEIVVSQEQAHVPVTIFHIKGGINMGNVDQLMQKAKEAFENGTRGLILDLAHVPSITSVGLRAIILMRKQLNSEYARAVVAGGGETSTQALKPRHLAILNPVPDVWNVLTIVGFDSSIGIYNNLNVALDAF